MSDEMIKIYEELSKQINQLYNEYSEEIKRLNAMWNDYKNAVNNIKKRWDLDNVQLLLKINELRASIDSIRDELETLKVKKELGLVDDEGYSRVFAELTETLTKLNNMYEDAKSKIDDVNRGIREHWFRSMDVTTLTIEQIDARIKELEEGKSRGELSEEVYERVRADLELIKRVVQALSIIRSETSKGQ
ncbi:hypothetical protein [Vulcanisaeta thermophila]|uniref:hypothetical protein n=1 Tax=Vulcanisaeta thermophila TaxID=867917 RepID=UPI000853AB71|nr:hypothetical protein [Vulcanisaeta thermophila]